MDPPNRLVDPATFKPAPTVLERAAQAVCTTQSSCLGACSECRHLCGAVAEQGSC